MEAVFIATWRGRQSICLISLRHLRQHTVF
jgi:hypothetical protein